MDREDILTRTTLRFGGDPSALALGAFVSALRRVPGVLTVEAESGAKALVAHDGAVAEASLLAAASGAGATAVILREALVEPAPSAPVLAPDRNELFKLAGVAVIAILSLAFVDSAFANSPEKRVLYLVLAATWAFVAARAVVFRR